MHTVWNTQELACGHVQQAVFKQAPEQKPVHLTLHQEHGVYHVRAHDFELGGRMKWERYDNATAARARFAELKRKYKAGMKAGLFNTTVPKGYYEEKSRFSR